MSKDSDQSTTPSHQSISHVLRLKTSSNDSDNQKDDESEILDLRTPSQGHYTHEIIPIIQINPPIDIISSRANRRKDNFKFKAIFALSALLGASIVLGETNLKRSFNEFKFTFAIIGLMGLLALFYYLFKTYKNTQNRLHDAPKDYIKLLISGSVGFILSYWITQIINAGPLFEQKISKNTAKWLYKTFHTNVSTVMTSIFVLTGICLLIFTYTYCKRHTNNTPVQTGSFFSRIEAHCDTLCDVILSIFLLSIFAISISAVTYLTSENLIQGWLNASLGLIAITFWFAVTCMFFLHDEYHTLNNRSNQRNINNQASKKGWLYYIGLIITFSILPMLAILMTIFQAGSQVCTIHNVISSFIIPMFIVLMVVGIFESMPFYKNKGQLNSPLYNANAQSYSDTNRDGCDYKKAPPITPTSSSLPINKSAN